MTTTWHQIKNYAPRSPWDKYQINASGVVRMVRDMLVTTEGRNFKETKQQSHYRTLKSYEAAPGIWCVSLVNLMGDEVSMRVSDLLESNFTAEVVVRQAITAI